MVAPLSQWNRRLGRSGLEASWRAPLSAASRRPVRLQTRPWQIIAITDTIEREPCGDRDAAQNAPLAVTIEVQGHLAALVGGNLFPSMNVRGV